MSNVIIISCYRGNTSDNLYLFDDEGGRRWLMPNAISRPFPLGDEMTQYMYSHACTMDACTMDECTKSMTFISNMHLDAPVSAKVEMAQAVEVLKMKGDPIADGLDEPEPSMEGKIYGLEREVADNTVKSDGGSSSYYQVSVLVDANKVEVINDDVVRVNLETGDIIQALVDNDFDLGNIIKAVRRIHEGKNGRGKRGSDVEYDCKKIEYFLANWYANYCRGLL